MFNLFTSRGCKHLDGHKELTKDKAIKDVVPEYVYIAATDGKGAPLTGLVPVDTTVKVGTLLGTRADFNLPVYSSVAGVVVGKEKLTNMALGRPSDFLKIKVEQSGQRVYLKPLSSTAKEDVVAKIREGGIVGLGGAGFPTYIKYATEDHVDTILINAIECEPYLTTDYVMGIEGIEDAFLAFPALVAATGARQVVIAVKKTKPQLIAAIEKAIANHPEQPYVRLKLVKDVYPMGWEKFLVKAALGRDYEGLPCKCGVIVNNLQTAMTLGALFSRGETVATRVYTVSGEVYEPLNCRAPYGTLVSDLIKAVGGYPAEEVRLMAGGPMTSPPLSNDKVPTLLQTSGVTVLPRASTWSTEPCLRCGACTDHCPAFLQPVEIKIASENRDVDRAAALKADACIECGLCSYVCPSRIEVTAAVSKMKKLVKLKAMQAKK